MKIVVIGGTGLIGSKTVAILRQSGHEVVAASLRTLCLPPVATKATDVSSSRWL